MTSHAPPLPVQTPTLLPSEPVRVDAPDALHARDASPAPVVLVGTAATLADLEPRLARASRAVQAQVVVGAEADPAGALHALPLDRGCTVLLSLPRVMCGLARRLMEALDARGVAWAEVATLEDQLAAGRLRVPGAGDIDPAALIDRPAHPLDTDALGALLTGRRVLITGAGGSIGSELARVALRFGPESLVLADRSENSLFEIDRELRAVADAARVGVAAELHDITHPLRTRRLMERHRPHVVLHAAAHKHVPMMEDHPGDAIENNFLGTRNVTDAARAAGVERLVMISSDKAVNPSSVMGATKRLAELYVQAANAAGGTRASMVRFGNVLGSACSVLPIWADQLHRGGPLTVTHRDMTRYFMTIPEAAGLVLQAGAMSCGGEVFLLDMGAPVRIHDLAERFLRAQGLEPGVDVGIHITGPRPGEKLFEELSYAGEDTAATAHPAVFTWRTAPPSAAHVAELVATFTHLRDAPATQITTALRAAVPEMVSALRAG